MKLKELSKIVSGKLVGNGELNIKGVSTVEEAGAGDLVFVLETKYLAPALRSKAAAIVTLPSIKNEPKPAIQVTNPRLAMALILKLFQAKTKTSPGIHKTAVIAKSVKLGQKVTIYPNVFIGEDCEIGDGTIIHPNVTVYDRVKIGRNVIIHAGACLGVDGFGFVWDGQKHEKIPQIGTVILEDNVEIFANVTIARGTLGATVIGQGTKIDCLTHIAHNCVFGKNCAITALVGFAGSVTFEDHVSVGGMAGFNGHITVGENSVVMAKAGVTKDIPKNSIVSGFPAQNHAEELKFQAALKRLVKSAEPKNHKA